MESLVSLRRPQYDGQDHEASWGRHYPLKGQGTLMFNIDRCTTFSIIISPDVSPDQPSSSRTTPGYISLTISKDGAEFALAKPDGQPEVLTRTRYGGKNSCVPGRITTYWFSFDHSNLVIKYGKGYTMEETTLMTHNFIPDSVSEDEKKKIRKEMAFIFSPKVRKVVMLYDVAPLPKLRQLYSFLASHKSCASLDSIMSSINTTQKAQFVEKTAMNSGDLFQDDIVETEVLPAMSLMDDEGDSSIFGDMKFYKSLNKLYQVTTQTYQIVEELISTISWPLQPDEENQGIVEVEKKVDFSNFPLVSNLSPFVIDSSKVTLFDLDSNNYMFSASLPATCVELYSNVKNCDLNYSPKYEKFKLTDAIGHSISTPGCLLYEKLQEKKREGKFGPGADNEIYLRVTLGHQRGQSPGIPYVLEIWPSHCGSPIHNHGNTYAVIHVLHGHLNITVYNKDLKLKQKLKEFKVKKGDITWISPNWYQTHKLYNPSNDYCATIQCYQYGNNDNVSWPYFDYLSTTSEIDEFLPDSDFNFSEMRKAVMDEYQYYWYSRYPMSAFLYAFRQSYIHD